MEAVQHALGVRAPPADARVDPAGPVPGDDADGGALSGRQRLEEQVEHVPAVPVVRPDHPAPLVVDDHGQVRVALPVAGLVHADRVQAVKRRGHRGPDAIRTLRATSSAILHDTCRNPLTVFWFATPISHAHSDSKSRVNRLPGSAHGTEATTTPHFGQSTRSMAATSSTRQQPKSWPRHRRTPPPWSYLRRLLPQREHPRAPARGRTRISSTGSGRNGESTIRASSTTMPLTLRSWLNMLFIRRFAVVCLSWSKTSYPESALLLLPQQLNGETPPTKTAIAPLIFCPRAKIL